jgi:hypothetical protein
LHIRETPQPTGLRSIDASNGFGSINAIEIGNRVGASSSEVRLPSNVILFHSRWPDLSRQRRRTDELALSRN